MRCCRQNSPAQNGPPPRGSLGWDCSLLNWSKSVEIEATVKHSTATKNPTGWGTMAAEYRRQRFGRKLVKTHIGFTPQSPPPKGNNFTLGKCTMCGVLLSLWDLCESKHWPADEEGLRIPRADCNPTAGVICRTLPEVTRQESKHLGGDGCFV